MSSQFSRSLQGFASASAMVFRLMNRSGPLLAVLLASTPARLPAAGLLVDGAQTYQVIDGFGVNANHRSWQNDELKPVIDAFIEQAGMTLFHVIFDNNNWEAFNDNGDPHLMNWGYYNSIYSNAEFQKLWGLMGYLNQRGITNGVVPELQGPVALWMGGLSLTPGFENEYAESIASLLFYARYTQHLQFGVVGPINEPDIEYTGIHLSGPDQYVAVLRALASQLDGAGMSDIRFSGPDLANTSTAWLEAMMNDAVVMGKLAHFGLHSYLGTTPDASGVYDFIQQSAYPDRQFWMTEYNVWCNRCAFGGGGDHSWNFARGTAAVLLDHLAKGASGALAWEGYDSQLTDFDANSGGNKPLHWSSWGLWAVEDTNAVVKTYTPRKGFYTVAQVTRFVRPGARRVLVSNVAPQLTVLGFCNTNNGEFVLTGVNTNLSAITWTATLTNLPTMTNLDLYYTDSSHNLFRAGSAPVSNGWFSVTAPADSVFTLVATNPPSAAGSSPTFSFGLPAAPVWDISGNYQITNHVQGPNLEPQEFVVQNLVLNLDSRGRVQGAGTSPVSLGPEAVAGDYKIAGKTAGGGTKTRVNFTLKCKGQGTVAGALTSYDLNAKYSLQVIPGRRALVGKVNGSAHFGNGLYGRLMGDVALPLPADADGGWTVSLDPIPSGTKLSGTAVVLVDNHPQTALPTRLRGNLARQSGVASVKLVGEGDSAGTSLSLQYRPASPSAGVALKGKVLGQTVKN